MYNDYRSLINCFSNNIKHDGSIKQMFSDMLSSQINGSRFIKDKVINQVFLRNGLHGSRTLLPDYELDQSAEIEDTVDDDQLVLNLISKYLNSLNSRNKSNRAKYLSTLVLFLMRKLSDKYYLLSLNSKSMNDLLVSSHDRIEGSKIEILNQLRISLLSSVLGGEEYVAINTEPQAIIDRFLEAHPDEDIFSELDDEDEDITPTDSLNSLIDQLGLRILLLRNERLCTKEKLPYLNSDQLAKMRVILKDYRSIYIRIHSTPSVVLLSELLGVSYNTVNKYKTIIAKELNNLSDNVSATQINNYLLNQ